MIFGSRTLRSLLSSGVVLVTAAGSKAASAVTRTTETISISSSTTTTTIASATKDGGVADRDPFVPRKRLVRYDPDARALRANIISQSPETSRQRRRRRNRSLPGNGVLKNSAAAFAWGQETNGGDTTKSHDQEQLVADLGILDDSLTPTAGSTEDTDRDPFDVYNRATNTVACLGYYPLIDPDKKVFANLICECDDDCQRLLPEDKVCPYISIPFECWDTSKITDMSYAFGGNNNVWFDKPIGSWDTSSVTSMHGMFLKNREFNQPIGSWDTARVVDMDSMFLEASSFDKPIGGWKTASVTDMDNMFSGSAFDHPLADWDVSAVIDMNSMFFETPFNQPIGDWDTSSVTDMNEMFHDARNFDQPLADWNTSSVRFMFSMFRRSNHYEISDALDNWNTTAVLAEMEIPIDDAPGNPRDAPPCYTVLASQLAGDASLTAWHGGACWREPQASIVSSSSSASGLSYGIALPLSLLGWFLIV